MKISKVRALVAAVFIFGLSVLALVLDTGFGTFSAWGIGYIAAICPVGALESWLGAKSVSIHGIICVLITIALCVVFGKFLCSWLCPLPWLQKFFGVKKSEDCSGLGDNRGRNPSCITDDAASDAHSAAADGSNSFCAQKLSAAASTDGCFAQTAQPAASKCTSCTSGCALKNVGGARDGAKVDSRHVVLGGALVSSLAFGFPVFCLVCPVGLSFATLIGLWNLLRFNETTWGMIIFPVILVLEVVFLRKWCFKFCPISAVVSLISRANKTFRPSVDKSKCLRRKGVDCRACVEACPEMLDPHSSSIPECSKCHACAEACPAGAITYPIVRK